MYTLSGIRWCTLHRKSVSHDACRCSCSNFRTNTLATEAASRPAVVTSEAHSTRQWLIRNAANFGLQLGCGAAAAQLLVHGSARSIYAVCAGEDLRPAPDTGFRFLDLVTGRAAWRLPFMVGVVAGHAVCNTPVTQSQDGGLAGDGRDRCPHTQPCRALWREGQSPDAAATAAAHAQRSDCLSYPAQEGASWTDLCGHLAETGSQVFDTHACVFAGARKRLRS